ncbi:MAG TPA: glycosyltransferase, partial [Bacteroidales bacterium]|nr:glycosyltransferase [Bacteroidales bacterium]
VHEVWWEMEDQLINPEGFLENRFINYPDYIFTYSEKFIPYLQKKYRLDTSIYPLPNYPSTDDLKNRIDKLTFIPSYKFPNNYRLKVVFAGRIIPNSGLYSFIQVMRYFENIELHVYGYHSQNSRKRINNIIYKYKLDDRVYFHDPVASANILKELQKYDVGIILYKKGNKTINYKTFSSTKLYMYFHAGLPVICTKVESYLKDFEKYNFMYWVDWDNIISLKNSIRKIYKESNESFLHKKNECLNVSNKMIWECNEGILRQVYNEFGIKTANERK